MADPNRPVDIRVSEDPADVCKKAGHNRWAYPINAPKSRSRYCYGCVEERRMNAKPKTAVMQPIGYAFTREEIMRIRGYT